MDLIAFFNGDINRALSTAQMLLKSTELGRGGVVRAEIDSATQKIVYRMMATGTKHDSIEDAFLQASDLRITQFERIIPSTGRVGTTENNPRRAQMGAILQNMQDEYDRLKALQGTEGDKFRNFLARMAPGAASSDQLSLNIVSTKSKRGSDVKQFLSSADKELGGYIPIFSDEGVDILQFSLGNKKLTSSESHLLLAYLGNDILSNHKIIKAFGTGSNVSDIEEYLSKIGKRVRGFTSERDLNMTIDDIRQFMGLKQGQRTGYVVEEGLDVFRRIIGQAQGTDLSRDMYAKKIMGKMDIEGIISAAIELTDPSQEAKFRQALTDLGAGPGKELLDILTKQDPSKVGPIGSTYEVNTTSRFKDALGRLKDSGSIDDDIYKFFGNIVDVSEKEFDGIAVLNKRLITGAKRKIKESIKDLESRINQRNWKCR